MIFDNIPKLLQYFIPGYWALFIFKYFTSKKISNYITNIMACVISYILISFLFLLRIKIKLLELIPDTPISNSGIAIILGTIFSIVLSILFTCKWFSKLMVVLFHKTLNEDIWRDVLDFQNGSNLKIYLKSEDYYVIGHHKNLEEKGEESWITLSGFAKYNKKTNKNYMNEPSYIDDNSVTYMIRIADIEHIEIF